MTDQPMDHLDYLIRQQQQDHTRQQFDALFTKDEDHAAAVTQGIEDQAYYAAQEAAASYDYVQDSLTDVITQARDLRQRVQSGTVPEKDARKLLADLRKQRAELVAKIAPTKSKYDSAHATLKDPAGRRDALIARLAVLIAINGGSKLSIFVLRAARDQINLDDFGDDDFDQ